MKQRLMILMLITCVIFSSTPLWGQKSSDIKRIAILEAIDKDGKVPYGLKLMIRSKLTSVITSTPGYEGYDRVDYKSIISEHEFQRTGMVSDDQIKQLGAMVGADYILTAEVAYLNDTHVFLSANILNVETGRLERTANIESGTNVNELEKNCRILAGQLLDVNSTTGAISGELIVKGNRYIGEYKDDKPWGHGEMYFSNSDADKRKSYNGEWVNGLFEGEGTLVYNNGQAYVGSWSSGMRNGKGTEYYANGDIIYQGEWSNDQRHGKGKVFFDQNDIKETCVSYDGEWINGIRQGDGIMIYNNGDKYEGEWFNNIRQGKGKLIYNDGRKLTVNWMADKPEGEGTIYYPDGSWETLNFENGLANGAATYYYKGGNDYEKGSYVNGKRDGKWEVYQSGRNSWTFRYKDGDLKLKVYHKPKKKK